MEDLLHWAVEHSDPDKLKEVMQKYRDSNLTLKDVYGQEVLDALFYDEYEIVRGKISTIADFRNTSLSDEQLSDALAELEGFVEQIDNAGNLHKMGGLAPLVELALAVEDGARRSEEVRAQGLLVLGIAVQNNPSVQEDLFGLEGLQRLAGRLPHCGGGAALISLRQSEAMPSEGGAFCGKLLYTLSGLVKNNQTIQRAANHIGLFDWILRVGVPHSSLATAKKSMALLDTVLAQNPELPFLANVPAALQAEVATALLGHVRGLASLGAGDLDAAEKSLQLVARLLAVRPMLFSEGFRIELASAASGAKAGCETSFGVGDELCETLASLASQCDAILSARSVRDDEL